MTDQRQGEGSVQGEAERNGCQNARGTHHTRHALTCLCPACCERRWLGESEQEVLRS